jgi:hypothetical protein
LSISERFMAGSCAAGQSKRQYVCQESPCRLTPPRGGLNR